MKIEYGKWYKLKTHSYSDLPSVVQVFQISKNVYIYTSEDYVAINVPENFRIMRDNVGRGILRIKAWIEREETELEIALS